MPGVQAIPYCRGSKPQGETQAERRRTGFRALVLCTVAGLLSVAAGAAEAAGVFDRLPPLNLILNDNEELIWTLPPLQYFVGIVAGLALALYSIAKLAARGSGHRTVLRGGGTFARFGAGRALLANGFVWAFMLLIAGFAGLLYSGFFALVRDKAAETLPDWVSWGPAGASIIATFAGTLLARRFSWLSASGGVELEQMFDDLEEQSANSDKRQVLYTLSWASLEEARQSRITELANIYSVGLIQYALHTCCDAAIDRGLIDAADVNALLAELDAVPAGDNVRERFLSRRRALQIASHIVPLEDIEAVIERSDRRKAQRRLQQGGGPRGRERRDGSERRIDGVLVTVPA